MNKKYLFYIKIPVSFVLYNESNSYKKGFFALFFDKYIHFWKNFSFCFLDL